MSRRLRKTIERFIGVAAPIQGAASTTEQEEEFDDALGELEFALTGEQFEATAVERLLASIDLAVRRGFSPVGDSRSPTLDARSQIAESRLDVGTPMSAEEAAEVLAEPRTRLDRLRADAAFLRDSGLLFEVNRRVLHPLGLAIAVEADVETGTAIRISPSLLRVDDPGGITFSDSDLEEGLDRLREFMKDDGYPRLAARYSARGFRGQVPEDCDPRADEADWTPATRELASDARAVVESARDLVVHLERPRYVVTVENGRMSDDAVEKINDAISEMREDADDDVDYRVDTLCRKLSVDDVRVVAHRVSAEPDLDDLREALKRYDGRDLAAEISPGLGETVDPETDIDVEFERVADGSGSAHVEVTKLDREREVREVVIEEIATEYNIFARRIDGEIVVRWVGPDGKTGSRFTLLYRHVRRINEERSDDRERLDDLGVLLRAVETKSVLEVEVERDGDRLRLVGVVGVVGE